jgi:drug/metabolite transporter (DMT)-like permease
MTAVVRETAARGWLAYALMTTAFWGIWGALIEIPEKAGFPATLGYSVWALTMVPCAVLALRLTRARVSTDRRSIRLGLLVGALGAGGQLLLFEALRAGPAYLVFPIVSLYPVLTIVLSLTLLHEHATRTQWTGITLALPAMALLSYSEPQQTGAAGSGWLAAVLGVFVMWGVQAYGMKLATGSMAAESLFAYMALTAVLLVPVALLMTDFRQAINWGPRGAYLAGAVHLLNSIGALTLVRALRHGPALIVVPLTALAPVITIVLSLALYGRIPLGAQAAGMVLAAGAIYCMAD